MNTTINNFKQETEAISLLPIDLYKNKKTPMIGVETDNICTEIHEACRGWRYDANRLIKVLGNTVGRDRKKVSYRYPQLFDKPLTTKIADNCGNKGDFADAAKLLSVGPAEAECKMLQNAMDTGADKVMLYSILCGRSNKDIDLLKTTYNDLYGECLYTKVINLCSDDLKDILTLALKGEGQSFDSGYHTETKAHNDAEAIYKAGPGRKLMSAFDETAMARIVAVSPPKYVDMLDKEYFKKYSVTLEKAFEKCGEATKFILGMKLEPYLTIAHLIKKATRGIGANKILLTSCLIRYQDLMGAVSVAHVASFEKSIQKRIRDEYTVAGSYLELLLALLEKVAPEA
jgi:hypothetical protein